MIIAETGSGLIRSGSVARVQVLSGPGAVVLIGTNSHPDNGVVSNVREFGPYPEVRRVYVSCFEGTTGELVEDVSDGTTLTTGFAAPIKTTASRAENNAALASRIADMDAGQTLLIPVGRFQVDIVPSKALRIFGVARPSSDGSTMTGGTIIQGEINIQNRLGTEIGFLGIDQTGLTPGAYPNLLLAGISTPGDSTTVLNQYIHDVELLGRGFAGGQNQAHGIIVQNGRGALVERAGVWRALNNFVSRASGVVFKDSFSYNSDAGAVLLKSDTAGGANDCLDNLVLNVRGYATTGFQALFSTRADTSDARVCNNNQFVNCLAEISSGTGAAAAFNVYGIASTSSNRGTLYLGCTSRNDQSGTAFLVNDNFSDGVAYVGCRAERFSGFSFQSNATGATNLPVAIGCTAFRVGFENIVNAFGRWAQCNINGQEADVQQTLADLGPAGFGTRRRFISDASSPVWGAVAVGGGSTRAPVYDDGVANWRIG